MEEEIYKKIEGSNDYEISNYGHVRKKRTLKSGEQYRQVKLQFNKKHGYYQAMIYVIVGDTKKMKLINVHKVVAEYFVKKPDDEDMNFVFHKDGDMKNNYYKNLGYRYRSDKMSKELGIYYKRKENRVEQYHYIIKKIVPNLGLLVSVYKDDWERLAKDGFKRTGIIAASHGHGSQKDNPRLYKGYEWEVERFRIKKNKEIKETNDGKDK